jgi:DNA modification methylase
LRLAKRPSGIQFGENSFRDCGGSIPQSLITAVPNGVEEAQYRKAMRKLGRAPHPAILPAAVARFGILLATEPGHCVYDPFSGSGTVPVEAMKLGRYAIGSERSREYLEGSLVRAKLAGIEMQQIAA